MDSFDNIKKQALAKKDKSKKQSVDKRIIKLLSIINSKKDYFTTSSCAGRISIIKFGKNKPETRWIFVTHEKTSSRKISEYLKVLPDGKVYFKQEAFILHIICRTLEHAHRLLVSADGVRRKGIRSIKNKIVVELVGSSHFETIISKHGKLLIDRNYLKHLVAEANSRLAQNWKKIKALEKRLAEAL